MLQEIIIITIELIITMYNDGFTQPHYEFSNKGFKLIQTTHIVFMTEDIKFHPIGLALDC